MGFASNLAMPSPAHIESKTPETTISPLVSRKQSFRGFSASSLSSLTLGRNAPKRNSAGSSRRSMNFLMSGFRDHESSSDSSRPPSLITDNSSLASVSSRSPSPEPSIVASRLETAFKSYTATDCPKLINNVLLPILSSAQPSGSIEVRPSTSRKTSLTSTRTSLSPSSSGRTNATMLEESDLNVLFKWWNHLLLLSTPSPIVFQAVHAIASHSAVRHSELWNPHYELTLSTTLALSALHLPSTMFAKLIALGYVYHSPTSIILRSLFTDPTKTSSSEPWVKRAKNVEVFIETSKHVYTCSPDFDDAGVIAARLEDMIAKVIHVPSYPNHRLTNLCRLLANSDGAFASLVESCLKSVTMKIGVFDCVAAFYLLELLTSIKIDELDFWIDVMQRIIQTENHVLQIRVFAFLYETWPTFSSHTTAIDMLISPGQWHYFFSHWSGLVRDHFMRLIAYQVCLTHPHIVRDLLMRSFETSLLENCQLRDCLPGNPIPNKRFVIRPLQTKSAIKNSPRELKVGEHPAELFYDDSVVSDTASEPESTVGFVKKRLGMFRGIWTDEAKDETMIRSQRSPSPPSRSLTDGSMRSCTETPHDEDKSPQPQKFRFVPEYVGKQWSLTSDADAIRFLDSVMDAARSGRLPQHALPMSPKNVSENATLGVQGLELASEVDEDFVAPFPIEPGRKRLWTRSLSEWSTLLDETDRFWRNCGGRSLTSTAAGGVPRRMNCPKLEVDFPRWFVQRSTQIPGDG